MKILVSTLLAGMCVASVHGARMPYRLKNQESISSSRGYDRPMDNIFSKLSAEQIPHQEFSRQNVQSSPRFPSDPWFNADSDWESPYSGPIQSSPETNDHYRRTQVSARNVRSPQLLQEPRQSVGRVQSAPNVYYGAEDSVDSLRRRQEVVDPLENNADVQDVYYNEKMSEYEDAIVAGEAERRQYDAQPREEQEPHDLHSPYYSGLHPSSVKEFDEAVPAADAYSKSGGSQRQRLEFQVHGLQGPHSYRFGYDTGKGFNRQFRFEERDNYGNVKGRYGFYDKYGKLQIVNYTATPKGGFHAEGDFGKYPNIQS